MDLEVRHLRVLNAIADTGSITRAAAVLGFTQPALTAQLQRIERLLGGPLFVRDGGGSRPTAFGAMVLSHAHGILTAHEDLMRDVRQRGPGDSDLTAVRLGSVPGPLTAVLVTTARRLLPRAEITLHTCDTEEEQLELLATGRLDFGLVVDYPEYELAPRPGLSDALVAVDPIFVLISERHPLADRPDIPLAALSGEPWLTGEYKDVRMRAQFRAACRRAGFTPRRVQRLSGSVVFPLVGQGHGVALAHPLVTEREGVVVRPLTGDPMHIRQRLVWAARSPLAEHAPALHETLTKAYWAEARRAGVYWEWLESRGRVPTDSAGLPRPPGLP
ncbi:LysR family transcriptional regulator [Streptomyces graminilatus]|uniref:LysR family transcriptional regulator n=1 Tax=Streptomyces graminilatus TaxID=1464070 RepID=UPI0006E24F3E|nr:LysR family transcriptional regulator [Streptomyces graminilatus]